MKELVVISGKGGTGKTSLTASFAVLAGRAVIADCDVDAADLHLIMSPRIRERHDFYSGHIAIIRPEDCTGCGECMTLCRFEAVTPVPVGELQSAGRARYNCQFCDHCVRSCPIRMDNLIHDMADASGVAECTVYEIDPSACEGCGVCVRFCPAQAIDFRERLCGEWMVSETRSGPMVHARLGVAAENSGKLVSTVRAEARTIAEANGHPLVIVDGPPGIGCPVISSVTGASLVLVVTEPTVSGEHDLERALSLARHFGIPTAVCVNKWDINPGMAARIEENVRRTGAHLAGRIRYDRGVTGAQMREQAVVECETPAGDDIRAVWNRMEQLLAD